MANGQITRLTMDLPKTTPEEREQTRAMSERWRKELAEADAEWLRNATPKQREWMRLLDEDPEMDLTPEMMAD
jgi:hypothetical protein